MKNLLLIIAIAGLISILIISVLYARGTMSFLNYKLWLVITSLVWFGGILIRGRVQYKP